MAKVAPFEATVDDDAETATVAPNAAVSIFFLFKQVAQHFDCFVFLLTPHNLHMAMPLQW